ncbi:IS5/IS1182 family transposase [Nocardiopsis kunsanensis]|uniref:IS5 family transposase n=1 Tax=Nocardiopsis kunsanensis TaxID=141693 RepID=A0A918XKI8_9ACTN|nr:IS5/IS1182 family transposase [Nocardiopsis kunsanensis]GHD36097.1 IS5 family transposase [Nocardiopsis kunsanensis]
MVTYTATLDVPREVVYFLSQLLATERKLRGTRKKTRALTCFKQALMALRHFRDGTDPQSLARDHGIGRSTAYRYIDAAIDVLVLWAPDLQHTLADAREHSLPHLVLDGIVINTDRCSEKTTSAQGESIDLWYSGKAHQDGGNLQALMDPTGFPLFVSEVEPGSVHDLTAARTHVLGALYAVASLGLPTLADLGYQGAGIGVVTPFKRPEAGFCPAPDNRVFNRAQRALRCLGERGFALLTRRWRLPQHVTAGPSKIGDIAKAALVLTHFEHGHLK